VKDGDPPNPFGVSLKNPLGKALRFTAKDKKISFPIVCVDIRFLAFFGEEKQLIRREFLKELFQGGMAVDLGIIPIVESGSLQVAVCQVKSQPADQMQREAGCSTQAHDVPGVGRDLGFN